METPVIFVFMYMIMLFVDIDRGFSEAFSPGRVNPVKDEIVTVFIISVYAYVSILAYVAGERTLKWCGMEN